MRRIAALALLGASWAALVAGPPAIAQVTDSASVPPAGDIDQNAPGAAGPAQTREPDAESAPGDIVVTARLRAERLRDVPVSATAIDAQLIADQGGVRIMRDVVGNTPGVHFLDTGTPTTSEISIRGSQTSRGTNADTTVGLYRDGVFVPGGYLSGRSLTPMDLFDVQRIEVLRGPQGGLYGRNAVGGAVVVTTNKPGDTLGASGQLSYGRFNRAQGEAIVNLPVDDMLAFRFGVQFTDQSKGYVYNPTRREFTDDDHYFGYKGQARLKLSDATNINLSYDHFRWNAPPLLLVVNIPPGLLPQYPNGVFQERRGVGHNGIDSTIQKADTAIGTFDHDLVWAKFTFITSFRRRDNTNDFDSDAFDVALREQIRLGGGNVNALNPNNEQFSRGITKRWTQEARLIGGTGPLTWLIGGDYTVLRDIRRTTQDREPQPPPPPTPPAVVDNLLTAQSNSRSWSIYGSLGYELTSRFSLTAEARFTRDSTRFESSNLNLTTGQLVATQTFTARNADQDFAYTLAANYKFAEWLLYGRVGTAYRPGGFNADLGSPNAPNPVVPSYRNEDSRTWEVGAKGPIIQGVFVTAAAYISITRDVLDTQNNGCFVGGSCNTIPVAFLVNGGKARVYGFESDVNIRHSLAGGEVKLTLGGSYQRGKFLTGSNAGEELARVPHWLFTGNFNYTHSLFDKWNGFFNARFNSTHGGVQDVVNPPTPMYSLDNYAVVDFRAGVGDGRYEIAAFTRNTFNADPVIFRASTILRYLSPFTYGVQLSARF